MTYQKIIKVLGLPDGSVRESSAEKNKIFFVLYLTHPHDLRHTYATLLDQNNMNMKVVSEILGHYSEEFTNEVYVIHKPEVIIYDTSEVMNSFIESLKLDSTERTIPVYDISFIQEYLF